jgi:hypothetical protein
MIKRTPLETPPVARSFMSDMKAYHAEDNPLKRGEIGPDLFRAACNMGLEGLISKRRDRPYRAADRKTGLR